MPIIGEKLLDSFFFNLHPVYHPKLDQFGDNNRLHLSGAPFASVLDTERFLSVVELKEELHED